MSSFRSLCLPLLGAAALTLSGVPQVASAQTKPKASPARKPAPRMVPNTTPAARAADPLRGTNNNGQGNNVYAAPGEPVNVRDNGKNTPPYDGPAPQGAARTRTTLGTVK
ncbi:hypothetical protein QMK33_13785 [Hymenobacter sp. H14-R3]|uniref:hypothetical protein n=1 Tax=Hymenobacter sp. H14-R3 TaxID=3046308 RepID=UPI0024BB60DA|nr:hypothetical protein [Hymenobacter sp. H14-R3]MDJ0366225.1 hypothetical protein [Hymenobacter sp. H14-R3]